MIVETVGGSHEESPERAVPEPFFESLQHRRQSASHHHRRRRRGLK